MAALSPRPPTAGIPPRIPAVVLSGMGSEKGGWKHCWERVGDPTQYPAENGKLRYQQKYECKTCGATVTTRCSGRIRTSVWRKQGVGLCLNELVERIHGL